MATAAQMMANQANAQHSTGPRTEQGKAHSSQNRLSHGLSSREFIVLPGQETEFDEFIADLHKSVQPAGGLELDLFTPSRSRFVEAAPLPPCGSPDPA